MHPDANYISVGKIFYVLKFIYTFTKMFSHWRETPH